MLGCTTSILPVMISLLCTLNQGRKLSFTEVPIYKGVHLTFPLHIFSVQVKSRSMLHHGSVSASSKQNKRNLKKPNPNPDPNP